MAKGCAFRYIVANVYKQTSVSLIMGAYSWQHSLYHWSLLAISLVSFLINILIGFIFIRFRKRFFPKQDIPSRPQTVNHNKFLLSMVIGDLLTGFIGTITALLLRYTHNPSIYKLFGLIPLFGVLLVPVLSLVLLTTDRLVATRYTFKYESLMTKSRASKLIYVSWIIPLLLTTVQVTLYLTMEWNLELRVRNVTVTVICLLAFIVLTVVNFLLCRAIKKHNQTFASIGIYRIHMEDIPLQRTPSSQEMIREQNGKHEQGQTSPVAAGETICRTRNTTPNFPDGKVQNIVKQANVESNTEPMAKACVLTMNDASGDTRDCPDLKQRYSLNDRKITILCIWVILVFVVCWLPLLSYRISYVMGRKTVIPWLRRLSECLVLSNSLLNPCVYFLMRRDFRKLLRRLLYIC